MDWILVGVITVFVLLVFYSGYNCGKHNAYKECIKLLTSNKKNKKQKPKDLEYGNKS